MQVAVSEDECFLYRDKAETFVSEQWKWNVSVQTLPQQITDIFQFILLTDVRVNSSSYAKPSMACCILNNSGHMVQVYLQQTEAIGTFF